MLSLKTNDNSWEKFTLVILVGHVPKLQKKNERIQIFIILHIYLYIIMYINKPLNEWNLNKHLPALHELWKSNIIFLYNIMTKQLIFIEIFFIVLLYILFDVVLVTRMMRKHLLSFSIAKHTHTLHRYTRNTTITLMR